MTSSCDAAAALRLDPLDRAEIVARRADADGDLVARTRHTAEAVQRGWTAGYDAGWVAGHDRGLADAGGEIRRVLARMAAAADDLDRRAATDLADAEDAIVAAALDLARMVLDRELSSASDPGAEAIARALALTPTGAPLTIRLAPRDADRLSAGAVPGDRPVTLVADASIEDGGCIVEAGATQIDAQLGPALDRARTLLLGGDAR